MTNERFQSGSVTTPAKLFKYDLSEYTNSYLQSGSLSLEQKEKLDDIQLFPNPTSTALTLRFNTWDFEKLSTIEINDLSGRLIYSQAVEISNPKLTIQVTNLEKGSYFLLGKNKQNERAFQTTFQIE